MCKKFRLPAILLAFVLSFSACREEARIGYVVGTVLGPGCRTGSYAIQLKGKNRQYGIQENASYENVVETTNLPEVYQRSGQRVYFAFSLPDPDPSDQYLTYCTPPPQVTIVAITETRLDQDQSTD